MPKDLPENSNQKLVLISEAAAILGVSIDTVRRWDKSGVVHSSRPDGKNRYFSVEELEKVKFSQPLSITEAAKQLGLSATTLRRLEAKGLIKPDRKSGERIYRKEDLENFLHSDYFLRQKEVEKRILEPLEEPSQEAVPQAPRMAIKQKILGAMTEENRRRIAILAGVQRFFILILLGGAVSLAVVVAIFTLLFLFYPEQTGQFLGYRKSLSANMNPQGKKVLGVSTGPADPVIQAETVGQFLRPLSDISLAVVKKVDPATYQQIIPQEPIRDVNEVLAISSEGEIVPQSTLALPGSSYLKVPDSGLVNNLNVSFVGGKEPGEEGGDLAVLGEGGVVLGLKSVSGLSSGVVRSSPAGQLSSGKVSLTDDVSGSLSIAYGGTGGTTAATARTALGVVIGTDVPSPKGSGASGTWAVDISGNAGNVSGTVGAGNGGTGKTSWTKYAIPYLSAATTFGEVAIGSSAQVLQINSGATGYQWHTLTASDIGLSGVENTALSTWTGTSSLTTVGTLISGSTGTGFTLDFANSTLSGNISGANISGLAASDFTSDAISQWTNDSNYITASTTITGLIQSASVGTSYFTGGNVGIGTTSPSQLLTLNSTGVLGWDNGSGAADIQLSRIGNGILQFDNGTHDEEIRLYNKYTNASNNSYLSIKTQSSDGQIFIKGTRVGSSFSPAMSLTAWSDLYIGGSNTGTWRFWSDGHFGPTTADNTYDLGKSTNRVRSLYTGTSVISPLLIGGSATTSTLSLRSTSGVGTTGEDIVFQTGNNGATEAMRILNNGNVGIGNTAPETKLVVGNASSTGNLTVYGTGTTCTIGDGTGATSCSSDIRLKSNIAALGSSLDRLMQLNPVTFTWNDPLKSRSSNLGFIAQEVQESYPELVRIMPDGYLGLDYAGFVVPAVKAIQELNTQVASNSAEVQNLALGNQSSLKGWVEEKITAAFSSIKDLVVQNSLKILGAAEFSGQAVFQATVNFISQVNFKGAVFFERQPTFTSDTAGLAVIKSGDSAVNVKFTQEYTLSPIVTASLSLPETATQIANPNFAIAKRTNQGFTIQLHQPASFDLQFSWVAVMVKNPQTSLSKVDEATVSAVTTPLPLETTPEATIAGVMAITEASGSARLLKVESTELGYLRVRADRSTASEEVGQVREGQRFSVLEEVSGWLKIEYETGELGWVSGSYVTVE